MSSSLSPSDIPLLSNRSYHVLKGDIGASSKIVVDRSVTGFPPDHALVQNFICMNPGDPIPHNRVIECTDKIIDQHIALGKPFIIAVRLF